MSERCSKCGKVHASSLGAICGGVGTRYQARVRPHGYRRWRSIGNPTISYRVAVRRMAAAFAEGGYKRGDVIMWAEYYDPEKLCELVTR